jgi:cell division protein ZapA (FtsZ GTPase activity inhibitor)
MPKEQNVDVTIFGIKISLITDEPEEMIVLANDLNIELENLAKEYPGINQNLILILSNLNQLDKLKKKQKEIAELMTERENLDIKLKSILTDI